MRARPPGLALTGVATEVFRTFDAPSGTDPVADSATATLTLQAPGSVSVVGVSPGGGVEGLAFDVVDDGIDGSELADTITLDADLLVQGSQTVTFSTLGTVVSPFLDVANATGNTDDEGLRVSKLSGGSSTDAILVIADSVSAVATGPDGTARIPAAGGAGDSTIIDGLDVSHPGIENAVNVGDNTIFGGTFTILGTNFLVDGSGAINAASLSLLGPPASPGALVLPPLPDGMGPPAGIPGPIYYDAEADTFCIYTSGSGYFPLTPPVLPGCAL